jgi:hypothetical protein
MKKINYKIISYAVTIILIISTTVISVASEKNEIENDKIRIILIDTIENKITEKFVTKDIYNNIFNDDAFLSKEYIKNKIFSLNEMNIISNEKFINLYNQLFKQEYKNKLSVMPLNYDVLNIFNGILFRLEGEKITSIFDMNVFNLPILNTNISALFSGYSEFQGNGFIFSIGFLGIQNIFKYSIINQPHFSEINGAIVGFTGLLIISKGIQTENNDDKILGIGMDILTYWNEVE